MEYEVLRLKWDKYKTSYFDFFKIIREKHNYTDATLAVEGQFYPVHKLVMSACSEYFSDIFERTPCKSPVIVLKDVRSQDIEALLDYMYLGEVNVNRNEFVPLLKAAKCLRIKGLLFLDEDPAKLRKNTSSDHEASRSDSPPHKKRKGSNIIPSCAASSTLLPQMSVTAVENPAHIPSIPSHSTSDSSIIEQDETTIIKVEVDSDEEQEEGVKRENDCEAGSSSEQNPGRDYGYERSKIQHETENDGNTTFPESSLPQIDGGSMWKQMNNGACPVCAKVFRHKSQFISHYRKHTGEKPFACHLCSYRSSEKSSIKKHIEFRHKELLFGVFPGSAFNDITNIRKTLNIESKDNGSVLNGPEFNSIKLNNGACPVCAKVFRHKSQFIAHYRKHTGEKPFACHLCSYRSSTKNSIKKHIEFRHKELLFGVFPGSAVNDITNIGKTLNFESKDNGSVLTGPEFNSITNLGKTKDNGSDGNYDIRSFVNMVSSKVHTPPSKITVPSSEGPPLSSSDVPITKDFSDQISISDQECSHLSDTENQIR